MTVTTDKPSRYSIDISLQHRERLAALAKAYKLNQGEVIETLLDTMNDEQLAPHFHAKREAKVAARANSPRKSLLTKFKSLSAKQLAALEKMETAS